MPPPLKAAAGFGVSYRPFTDDDLAFVSDLYASTRREEIAVVGWSPEVEELFLAQQAAAQHNHYSTHFADAEWLIIEREGEAIGRLYLRDTTATADLHIVDISLVPGSRGQGIGGAILADVLDLARGLGRGVTIHVEKNNPARALYARLGFDVLEDRGVYDLLKAQP